MRSRSPPSKRRQASSRASELVELVESQSHGVLSASIMLVEDRSRATLNVDSASIHHLCSLTGNETLISVQFTQRSWLWGVDGADDMPESLRGADVNFDLQADGTQALALCALDSIFHVLTFIDS